MIAPNNDLTYLARELLAKAKISSPAQAIEPIHRGGNNQIFRVNCINEQFILKKYFQHSEDGRNRLESEFNFLLATQNLTPDQVPKALAKIDHASVALYEYIAGTAITSSSQITESHITQAAQYIANLNVSHSPDLEKILFPASEACFSIGEHLNKIELRLKELQGTKPYHQDDLEFIYILDEILIFWEKVKDRVIQVCKRESFDLNRELPQNERVLSPSDFGFHNAVLRTNQSVVFIDFEYAGWDDPAKLVGDFFSQVAIKVNPKYLNLFLNTAFGNSINYDFLKKRALLLFNTYKIKWCCIVLNIYIPKHLSRRQFSNPELNLVELKKDQLRKAQQLLSEISL